MSQSGSSSDSGTMPAGEDHRSTDSGTTPGGESHHPTEADSATAGDLDQSTAAVVSAFHRLMMERLEEGLEAIEEVAGSVMRDLAKEVGRAAGVSDLHERLDAVHAYLGSLGEYLNQRDRALLEWIDRKDAEQADHSWIRPLLEETEGRVKDSLGQQLRALHAFAEGGLERLSTLLDQRLTELSEQTWADQLALRRDLMELSTEHHREHMQELDERLGRVTELVNAALGWAVDQIHGHIERETLRSVEIGMADLVAALDRRFVDLNRAVMDRIEAMDAGLLQRVVGMDDRLTAGLSALEESFADRAGEAVDRAVERKLGPALDAMSKIATQMTASAADISGATEELVRTLTLALDDRVAQLARLIRSDNRALADRLEVVEEQAAAKEAIRAVNELAAAIPGEINDALDQRLTLIGELIRRESRSQGEVLSKAADALADRIDRMASRIGDRFDREVETVVDQIGGTMATLATGIQRAPRNRE
jgi:hypothetical protein